MRILIPLFAICYCSLIFVAIFKEHDGVYYNCLYAKGKPDAEKACYK